MLKSGKQFFWGAATSAHQVEGGMANDWSKWEYSHDRLADLKARNLNPDNFISGRAADHYRRFEEDFTLAASLGHNAHRFSIEWSRIEPIEGVFNEAALNHYRDVILALRRRGLEPFVTLWHFTLPRWLAKKGGWLHRQSPEYFARYSAKVAAALGDIVTYWITINEPEIYAKNAYLFGIWPPQRKNPLRYWLCRRHLMQAHRRAYAEIKRADPGSTIGWAKNYIYFEPVEPTLIARLTASFLDWHWNQRFFNTLRSYQDFIGLNYYFYRRVTAFGVLPPPVRAPHSDLGWEIAPEKLYATLMRLMRYQLPIFILENGLADTADAQRSRFIEMHIAAMEKAIHAGADVRGYFHWSLLDNFEWHLGFGPRFGLIAVDYATLERKPRPSAIVYKAIIKQAHHTL